MAIHGRVADAVFKAFKGKTWRPAREQKTVDSDEEDWPFARIHWTEHTDSTCDRCGHKGFDFGHLHAEPGLRLCLVCLRG